MSTSTAPTADSPTTPREHVLAVAQFRIALRRFLRDSDRIVTRHGLTPQRYLLLLAVACGAADPAGPSVGEVAARMQLGVNTSVELINRAEEAGLVRRVRSGHDGRVVHLQLTQEGEARLDRVLAEHEGEREQIERALQSLAGSFPPATAARSEQVGA